MIESRFGMSLVSEVIKASRTDAGSSEMGIPSLLLDHRLGSRPASVSPMDASPERLDVLLQARKSVRTFSARPVSANAIGRAVDWGIAADRELWPEENASGVDLELVLVAWSVDQLETGVYVWEDGSFRFIKEAPERNSRGSVTLQRGLQSAPALILAAGNLLASRARHGDHGYRLLLSRAGAACHTAWLAAIDEGLAGVIFAGFQPAAARYIFAASMVRRQLLALAVGYPLADTPV
jgi:Nitroreductase family